MRDKLHSIFLMHENVDVSKKGVHIFLCIVFIRLHARKLLSIYINTINRKWCCLLCSDRERNISYIRRRRRRRFVVFSPLTFFFNFLQFCVIFYGFFLLFFFT